MSKVKIQESSSRLSVTILKSVADLKGWSKGTMLEFKEHAGLVCLVEVRYIPTLFSFQHFNSGSL